MRDLRSINVEVNGEYQEREVETRTTLGDFLREELDLTGTHLGCEHGVCGACSVLLDGRAVRSCLMLAVQADGRSVTTVEGLARNQELNPLQAAFREHHALQCGFCTPGVLLSLTEFLEENPDPAETDVRAALSGNICRCTGYHAIVAAALDGARRLRTEKRA